MRAAAVRAERDGAVLRLTFNRPEKLNALNDGVRAALHDAVRGAREDTAVRVVVLRGAGRAFSAGADLTEGGPAAEETWAERRHRVGGWQRLLDDLEALPAVTVAVLHGHCIGGAALLAAACDLRIADATLQLRIPELHIGIPLTWGGVPRLAREIGLPLTRDLVMTGRVLDAREAHAAGFVQRLAAKGQLDGASEALADELLAMPEAALAITKAMTAALGRDALGAAAWADADLLGWSFTETEGRAAAAEYLSARTRKRDP